MRDKFAHLVTDVAGTYIIRGRLTDVVVGKHYENDNGFQDYQPEREVFKCDCGSMSFELRPDAAYCDQCGAYATWVD